jgi:hypothetical protein
LIHNTKSDEGEEIAGDPRQEVWSGQKKNEKGGDSFFRVQQRAAAAAREWKRFDLRARAGGM